MILCENSAIQHLAIHVVGNKLNGDPCSLAKAMPALDEQDKELLVQYFVAPFTKDSGYYNFYHNDDLLANEVYALVSQIFDEPKTLLKHSKSLARHLYGQSIHPKIKGGEFYVAYFDSCVLDGETVDAVGLFKSENKDTFLKIFPSGEGFEIEADQGININKLDKGCLIFDTERDSGFVVAVVDNTGKGSEAQYWLDDFLHVRPRKDEFYNTQNVLSLCKDFVQNELPQQFEISKTDQIDLLNKSVKFFKENDNFSMDTYANEVMEQPEVIESFQRYKSDYQQEHDLDLADNFAISESALRRQARVFKSVIKLDKNFHIYVHGNRELIEQGSDAKGRFYKIYFNEEN